MQYPLARRARPGAMIARGSAIVLALTLATCSTNEEGRLSASNTGDVSAPAITRLPTGGSADACGNLAAGAPPAANVLARAPYLQRVTAQDAVVVWTAPGGKTASVLLQSPDGKQKATYDAAIDTSAPMPDLVSQWPTPISFKPVRQWSAAVSGLSPDTTYCYTVVQDGQPVTTPAPLQSAPAPGTGKRVQFLALGDSGGGGSDQHALMEQMATVPYDFMIHAGDIAYDSGTLPQFESRFFGVYAPMLAKRPIFPASGNHEYETSDAAPFRQVFVLPENGGPDGVERWYSYDWGDIHFVALDTEKTGAEQAAWLEADLAANKLPWTIVYAHRPPRSSAGRDDQPFQRWFEPVLAAHHVQLVINGHEHHYERFKPRDGVTYVISGGGGRGVRELSTPAPGSAFADAVIHFVVVTVEGDTLTLHAIDATGREFDSAVIKR
jgi:hypothetical protein